MGATSSHERHPRLLFHPYVSRVPLEIVRVGTFRRREKDVLFLWSRSSSRAHLRRPTRLANFPSPFCIPVLRGDKMKQ